MRPAVSVIVPSYRSLATIDACLAALGAQETAAACEVIVVDSSDDGTGELIAERFPKVELVRLPARTLPGAARNLGVERARGQILAFTDADCVVEPRWVEKMRRAHEREDAAGIGGAVENGRPESLVAWGGCLLEFNEFLPSAPAGPVELLATCNASFRRDVFERHGGFPADLWPSEDHLFCHRLARAGERLLFDSSIRVRHLFRPRLSEFLRHQRRLGAASARARLAADLPHAWLVGHPLRHATPLLRLAAIEGRLLARDPRSFARLNLLLPLALAGLVAWGAGFGAQRSGREHRA